MLTLIDNITIVLCVIGIFWISRTMGKRSADMESFYHANKSLPWSLAVGTIAASWYGGNGTIGTVGYATSIGAHLVRFPLALWIAPKISIKVNSTMTELLERFYGRLASIIGAAVLIVSCLSISEVAATGYVGTAAWNANKFVAAAVVIAISISLTCIGGLFGVAITDMIFFFLMILSVSLVFPQVWAGIGGFAGVSAILDGVDPSLMTPLGGIAPGRAVMLILICINVYKDPAFYQRFTASNGPKTGKRAMLTCFSIWMSMDACLMFTALVLRAMDPGLVIQPEVAYIQLILGNLPPVLRGLFILGLMGAIISTMDSYYLIGGEIVANDIINKIRKNPLSDRQSIFITRVSCVIFGIVGLSVAFRFPLVYDAMILPVLMAIMYEGKKTNMAGLVSMFVGGIVWIWFTYNPVSVPVLGDIDAVLIALPISLVAYFIGNQFGTELNRGFAEVEGEDVEINGLTAAEYAEEIKVEWFGIDGALCLLYFGLACIYSFGILNRIDAIIGVFCPLVAAGMTTAIFLRYLFEVFSFGKAK